MDYRRFLDTGRAEGWIRDTNIMDNVFINGSNQACAKYDIRIDKLHYNPQNGRIATFISRYRAEHGELPAAGEELDDLIEKMIEAASPQRLKTTRLDIKAKGQQETAVVLSDGTVIDGNRRFTCLRQLSREEGQPRFMRCFVFPDTFDRKAIKALELDIQMGRDEKENYDEITRLVDIDECVNVDKLMTAEEYARHANLKPNEMKVKLAQVEILKEYLAFLGMPCAFHVAQDQKIFGALESLTSRLKKCKDPDQAEDVKHCTYTYLALQSQGDRARDIRKYCDHLMEDEDFMEEQLDVTERFLEKIESLPADAPSTTEFFRDRIATDPELKEEQNASVAKADLKKGNREIKNGQVRALADALSHIQKVDAALIPKLTEEQRLSMRDYLDELQAEMGRVTDALDRAGE